MSMPDAQGTPQLVVLLVSEGIIMLCHVLPDSTMVALIGCTVIVGGLNCLC